MNQFKNFALDLYLNQAETLRSFSSWIQTQYPEVHKETPFTVQLTGNLNQFMRFNTPLDFFMHEIAKEVLSVNPRNDEELTNGLEIIQGILRVLNEIKWNTKLILTYAKILDFSQPLYNSRFRVKPVINILQQKDKGSLIEFFCSYEQRWRQGVLVENVRNNNLAEIKADGFSSKSFVDLVKDRFEQPFVILGKGQIVDYRCPNNRWCLCYIYHEDQDAVFLKEYVSEKNVGWASKQSSDLQKAGSWRNWLQVKDKVDCFSDQERWGPGQVCHLEGSTVSVVLDYNSKRLDMDVHSYNLSRFQTWKALYNAPLSMYHNQMKGDSEMSFATSKMLVPDSKVMFHVVEPKPWLLLQEQKEEQGEEEHYKPHFVNMVEYFFQINSMELIFNFLCSCDNYQSMNLWVKILCSLEPVLSYPFASHFIPKFNQLVFRNLYRLCFANELNPYLKFIVIHLKQLNAKTDPIEGFLCRKDSFHEKAHRCLFDIFMTQGCPSIIKDVQNIIFSYWNLDWWLWDTWHCHSCSYENELTVDHCIVCGRKNVLSMSPKERTFYLASLQQTDCEI